jgi:hypothetical protein
MASVYLRSESFQLPYSIREVKEKYLLNIGCKIVAIKYRYLFLMKG